MNVANLINDNEYSVVLCLGDSITEANHCTEGYPGYVALLDEALRLRFRKNKYVVINSGIGGAHAVSSVEFISRQLNQFKPRLTTVMYGMNDSGKGESNLAAFEKAMNRIVESITAIGSEPVLMTQNPLDYGCSIESILRRRCFPDYMDAVRKCAAEKKVELVDVNAAWQREILEKDNNEHFKMMHDGIHPNHHGHRFIFERLKKQLLF